MLEHSCFCVVCSEVILFVFAQKLNWKKVLKKKRKEKKREMAYLLLAGPQAEDQFPLPPLPLALAQGRGPISSPRGPTARLRPLACLFDGRDPVSLWPTARARAPPTRPASFLLPRFVIEQVTAQPRESAPMPSPCGLGFVFGARKQENAGAGELRGGNNAATMPESREPAGPPPGSPLLDHDRWIGDQGPKTKHNPSLRYFIKCP